MFDSSKQRLEAFNQALQAMQSVNAEDSPYAHAYMDNLLGLVEQYRSGEMECGELLEQAMIDMVSFQQFLDMRVTMLERRQDPAGCLVIGSFPEMLCMPHDMYAACGRRHRPAVVIVPRERLRLVRTALTAAGTQSPASDHAPKGRGSLSTRFPGR